MTRDEIARALFACDEKHGPIRMNISFDQLKSFQRIQYERYAEAIEALRDSDRNPTGEDRETGLRAKHESAGPKDIARKDTP